MNVGIVGLGLMGASFGRALRAKASQKYSAPILLKIRC